MILSTAVIKNLRHFELYSARIPACALLLGDHGVGKTSFLEILKYAIGEPGLRHDPSMLRIAPGVEQGECEVTLEDKTILRLVVTSTTTERMIKVPGATRWSRSRADIDALFNALSYDPLKFADLSPREQINTLLRIMPIPVTREEMLTAVGTVASVPEVPAGANGLAVIDEAYGQIYDRRTKIGQEAETLKGYAAKIEAGLTPASEDGKDWGAVARELSGKIDILKKEEADLITRLTTEVSAVISSAASDKLIQYTEIDRDINERIAALERERSQRKAGADHLESSTVDAVKVKANIQIKDLRSRRAPEITKLTEDAATARERAEAQQREEGNREAVASAREDAAGKEADYKAMSEALQRLNALKTTVASRMKIKGIQILSPKPGMEPAICREEGGAWIPFSVWNTESQLIFQLRLAVMSHGKCGLVTIDSIADLNAAKQELLIKTARKFAKEEDMQFIMGRPDEPGMPLRIVDVGVES